MTFTRILASSLLIALSLTAAWCTTNEWKKDTRGVLAAIAQAPPKAREEKNPFDGNASAVRAGAKLYEQHCAECHGRDGLGTNRAANLHDAAVQRATDGELQWFLRNGNLMAGMPSWSGLPEQRRWQIIAYLKSLH